MTQSTHDIQTPVHGDGILECIVLDGRSEVDRRRLEADSGLDDAVRAMLSRPAPQNQRVHLGPAIVIGLVRTDDASADGGPIGVNILLEAARVVTVCFGTEALVRDALARHAEHGGQATAAQLLPVIVTALVKPLESEITRLADAIDDLEDKAMADDGNDLDTAVVRVGRQVLGIRRYLLPLRDELSFLAFNPDELPGPAEPRPMRRAAEYLARLVSALDSSHQRVTLTLAQLRNRDESRLARSMHKLTLVATVFLPLSFVTGLLGINVAGVPDAHDPFAFWLVCLVLVAVAILTIAIIRWRRWM